MCKQEDQNKREAIGTADHDDKTTDPSTSSKPVQSLDIQSLKDKRKERQKRHRDRQPLDLERQCGVELSEGGRCKRSVTCKDHTDEEKRDVEGRSGPFDELLEAYRERNRQIMMRAAFDANQPSPDDAPPPIEVSKSERRNSLVVGEVNKKAEAGDGVEDGCDKGGSKD